MSTDSFIIKGLAGKRSLKGTVTIHGAKNAALKAMAAAILFDGQTVLENIPENSDVITLTKILEKLGSKVTRNADKKLHIDPTGIKSTVINAELAASMRASVVLTGPLLARFGETSFPAPGGCVIGTRPIDQFIVGYKKMGATVKLDAEKCVYEIEVPGKSLKDAEIFFDFQTVGGTETLMMAAVLGKGTMVLKNCALEPEIINVAEWLNACGADISGLGTTTLIIRGTGGKLLKPVAPYVTIPDRIEAGSFLILAALCGEDVTIEKCRPDHMEAVINLLRGSGVSIEQSTDSLRITNTGTSVANASTVFKSFNIRTHEYPGFPTDLQAPIVTFLTQTSGEGIIFETIYEGRFKYIEDLMKLGATITIMNAREILVKGPTQFKPLGAGEILTAHDIRAGFAVVMAALLGSGIYTINNVHLIDRGYERLEEQLSALGAEVKRVSK
jgi:UDP-N-acetylglucosamine 1-carboxyvinyltransferase